MLRQLIQSWWLLHVRGIMAVIFGVFLLYLAGTMQGLFGTTIGLIGVMFLFVLYLICSGVLLLLAALKTLETREWFWAALAYGLLMLAVALCLFFSSVATFTWLVWLTAANAFGSGILEIVLAHAVRRHVDALPLSAAGVLSLFASIGLILARNAQVSRLVSALGVYAIVYGGVLIILSLRLHGVSRHLHLAQTK